MSLSRSFTGIFVPREIWLHEKISVFAKVIWAEVQSLGGNEEGGCFASNEYLCDFIGLKISRLKEVMKELRDNDLIIQTGFDGRKRILHVKSPVSTGRQGAGIPACRRPGSRHALI